MIIKLVKSFFVVLTFCLFMPHASYAFIESIYLAKSGNKRICIMGEVHNEVYTQDSPGATCEERDKAELLLLLKKLSFCPKPIDVVCELREYSIPELKKIIEKDHVPVNEPGRGILASFSKLSVMNNHSYGALNFKWADIRGRALFAFLRLCDFLSKTVSFAEPFFMKFGDKLQGEVNKNHQLKQALDAFYQKQCDVNFNKILDTCLPEIKKNFFDTIVHDSIFTMFSKDQEFTISSVFEAIDDVLKRIATCQSKIAGSNSMMLLEPYAHTINYGRKQVADFFSSIKSSENSLSKKLFYAARDMSIELMRSQYIKLLSLVTTIADVGFLMASLESLNSGDNLIFYAGNMHAVQLKESMTALGFEKVFGYGMLSYDKQIDIPVASRFSSSEITDMCARVNSFFCPQDNESGFKNSVTHSCSNCGKSDKKLLRCGRCKKVYYCSRDCQSKDWVTHRRNCYA